MPAYNTGLVIASNGVSVDRDGKSSWSNPARVTAEDGSEASSGITASTYNDWLRATFGLDLPRADLVTSIDGIEVVIKRRATYASNIQDSAIYLTLNGSQIGDNKAVADYWPTSLGNYTYGGPSDVWGTSLSIADLINSTFGVDISANNNYTSTRYGYVDAVSIKVYLTLNGIVSVDNASLYLIEGRKSVDAVCLYVIEGSTPIPPIGQRIFPIPAAGTIWQSQAGKRLFPLPGRQETQES